MTHLKWGGTILTGIGAWLLINKALDILRNAGNQAASASEWRNYYRCWSKGNATGEPIAPGYSRTTKNTDESELIDDPEGVDHSKEPKNGIDSKALGKACNDVVKAVDNYIRNRSKKPTEASEAVKTAFKEHDCGDTDGDLEVSIETARNAGVPEKDILHNEEEIDEFFGYKEDEE